MINLESYSGIQLQCSGRARGTLIAWLCAPAARSASQFATVMILTVQFYAACNSRLKEQDIARCARVDVAACLTTLLSHKRTQKCRVKVIIHKLYGITLQHRRGWEIGIAHETWLYIAGKWVLVPSKTQMGEWGSSRMGLTPSIRPSMRDLFWVSWNWACIRINTTLIDDVFMCCTLSLELPLACDDACEKLYCMLADSVRS
jgi:hypothetical protein